MSCLLTVHLGTGTSRNALGIAARLSKAAEAPPLHRQKNSLLLHDRIGASPTQIVGIDRPRRSRRPPYFCTHEDSQGPARAVTTTTTTTTDSHGGFQTASTFMGSVRDVVRFRDRICLRGFSGDMHPSSVSCSLLRARCFDGSGSVSSYSEPAPRTPSGCTSVPTPKIFASSSWSSRPRRLSYCIPVAVITTYMPGPCNVISESVSRAGTGIRCLILYFIFVDVIVVALTISPSPSTFVQFIYVFHHFLYISHAYRCTSFRLLLSRPTRTTSLAIVMTRGYTVLHLPVLRCIWRLRPLNVNQQSQPF